MQQQENIIYGFQNIFFYVKTLCLCCFVICSSGEATEDELFSRLQQIKDGPEQQNNTPSNERGEDPVGMFASSAFFVINLKLQI